MSDDPRSAEKLDAPPERPARRGFFAKVKRGLFMTHTEILEKLGTAVKQSLGIDESVLEALEEALLAADVGADTASALDLRIFEEFVDAVKETADAMRLVA